MGIVDGDDIRAHAARAAGKIDLGRINELAGLRQEHAHESPPGAQRPQIPAAVAVDQHGHPVRHVREHEIVHPHPVFGRLAEHGDRRPLIRIGWKLGANGGGRAEQQERGERSALLPP